jgi:trehalose 6-phosphate phosphatase
MSSETAVPALSSEAARAALVVHHTAFFLDFDGTLVELAATPDAVIVPEALKYLLAVLCDLADGALAIVSGRSIEAIDALLTPLVLPVAGLHGAEWRDATGLVVRQFDADERIEQMSQVLAEAVAAHPGMLLETKMASIALHYRAVPDKQASAREAAERAVALFGDAFVLQPGKMVFEIKPAGVNKGRAIETLLAAAPFAGRTPCFAGDDLTDEAGFAAVNALGGMSIKVGEGDTLATYRVEGVRDVLAWLAGLVRSHVQAPG